MLYLFSFTVIYFFIVGYKHLLFRHEKNAKQTLNVVKHYLIFITKKSIFQQKYKIKNEKKKK